MNFKNFKKVGWALLLMPLLFIASCEEDKVDPVVPVASFQVEVDAADFFKINTINVSKNVTSYLWDFGDGVGTSTDFEPSYTYASDGAYVVKLTATDDAGASAEFTRDITITDPDAALTLLTGSVSKTWKLVREGAAVGIGPNEAEFSSWFAAVNDGSRNCMFDDEVTFTRAGGFEFNDGGTMWGEGAAYAGTDKEDLAESCFEATVENMTIDGVDKSAWLSSTSHSYEYDVAANKMTLNGLGAWMGLIKLGTGGDVTEPQASTSFGIKLVSGGTTGVDTLNALWDHPGGFWKAVYVSYANPSDEPALPTAKVAPSFTFETVDKTVTFTNTSKNADTYSWDFGDGTGTSTVENPVYTYAADGGYKVILTATGPGGTETVEVDVAIGGPPFTDAAPDPTQDAATVISVYSDFYTSLSGVDTNPDWGQGTVVTEEKVGDDNVLKLAVLNYQGIDFGGEQDLTGKTMVHVDIWSEEVVTTNFSLISTGPAETPKALTTEAGTWTSFDIPLSDYSSVVDLTKAIQFKFDATGDPTFYVDNIYFY